MNEYEYDFIIIKKKRKICRDFTQSFKIQKKKKIQDYR